MISSQDGTDDLRGRPLRFAGAGAVAGAGAGAGAASGRSGCGDGSDGRSCRASAASMPPTLVPLTWPAAA